MQLTATILGHFEEFQMKLIPTGVHFNRNKKFKADTAHYSNSISS